MLYETRNNLDKGYMALCKSSLKKNQEYTINEIIDKYSLDLNDYYILKATDTFKIVDIKNIEKYATFLLLLKSKYSLGYINLWFNFLYKEIKIHPKFISKPFPPEYMIEKIKIINKD